MAPTRKSKAALSFLSHVDEKDATIFQTVKTFLMHFYRSSRKAQTIILCPESLRCNSKTLDGSGGAALLTELFLRVLRGKLVASKREFCKKILLAAAWSLRMPIVVMPSGALSVGIAPSGKEPRESALLKVLVRRLPFPDTSIDLILSFAGDIWVGTRSHPDTGLFHMMSSYAIEVPRNRLRPALRNCFPYPSCRLDFSGSGSIFSEWGSDPANNLVWIQAESLWPLITLLRFKQRSRGAPSLVMTIRGFGDVLI